MQIKLKKLDWYHCDIYQKNFWGDKKVASAKIDFDGNIQMNVFTRNKNIIQNAPEICKHAREILLIRNT